MANKQKRKVYKDLGHPFITGLQKNPEQPVVTTNDRMMVNENLRPPKRSLFTGKFNTATEKKAFKRHASYHRKHFGDKMNNQEDKAEMIAIMQKYYHTCRFNLQVIIK